MLGKPDGINWEIRKIEYEREAFVLEFTYISGLREWRWVWKKAIIQTTKTLILFRADTLEIKEIMSKKMRFFPVGFI